MHKVQSVLTADYLLFRKSFAGPRKSIGRGQCRAKQSIPGLPGNYFGFNKGNS
jgi:hypothetical protein